MTKEQLKKLIKQLEEEEKHYENSVEDFDRGVYSGIRSSLQMVKRISEGF